MENLDFIGALQQLTNEFPETEDRLSDFLKTEIWTSDVRERLLNELSYLLVNESYTIRVAELFSPLLLELLNRCALDANERENIPRHESLCVCLAKLVWIFPEAGKFAKSYFERSPNLLFRLEEASEPPSKKHKAVDSSRVSEEKLVETALQFLMYDADFFKETWNWSLLVPLLNHDQLRVSWYAYHCLAYIGNIRMSDLNTILLEKFGEETYAHFIVHHSGIFPHCDYNMLNKASENEDDPLQDDGRQKISNSDLSVEVVNVSGVLLNKLLQDEEVHPPEKLICVPSVENTMKQLALAVSSGEPVLLQGPVGSGKTSLVEHLAETTGRRVFENLLKVQLGEHMDSKMLVGTHCCTEVPGEFVWQPGILSHAMTEGYWLLLEDIDCAPMDVISLLAPVLKSRTLILPGHADPIDTAVGFQLFATQRLLSGYEGSYLEFKSNADMIDKQWRKITVDHFTREELKQVISAKWPVLEAAIDKILDVYYIYSSGSTQIEENGSDSNGTSFSHMKQGRLISTRDLFKFCGRIAENFDIASAETAVTVFQNAIECFCDHIANVNDRLRVAEAVGIKFNFPTSKADFFLHKHKPEVEIFNDSYSPWSKMVKVGRVYCPQKSKSLQAFSGSQVKFAHTRQAASLLEKVAVAVSHKEPVLLVGETGTGKTSIVQYLASITKNDLTVINMNQQSDSIDLIGGYKPVDLRFVISPVKEMYEKLFPQTFSSKHNNRFLDHITKCFYERKYTDLCTIMLETQKSAMKKFTGKESNVTLQAQWKLIGEKIQQMKLQIQQSENPLAFKFIEGALVRAMKKGDWLLLDEINLAEAETLECLAGVLERDDNSLFLLEKGDKEPVTRHADFRIFACMNPATDVGKKDLPVGIRNRFTEFFMEELEDKQDLMVLVNSYLQGLCLRDNVVENIVDFYLYIKKEAVDRLSDGTGHHPHYSLRTLCRALSYAAVNACSCVPRSLYEAFCLSFLSQLDYASHPFVTDAIISQILGKKQIGVLKQKIPEPTNKKCVPVQGYWIPIGDLEPVINHSYIITSTVQRNLHDLARIVSAGRYPVLLQGETSVGKTSLVQWLAQATGNQCLRVNNHEHTDIQEYVGTYSVDSNGKLTFKEGILVEAMRHGYWIILDELNLAPTDVMEALNRVLDDNRELFIAETQQTVKAHPHFMVFATQNPAGQYGGRKILSRAFRNRFIELHFNEIPAPELEIILEKRCALPLSYSKKLVKCMQELQLRRRESGVFAGKQGYITLRDLFRWGERYRQKNLENKTSFYDWNQHLADEGYMLLAGRVRRREEEEVIIDILQKNLKRPVDPELLFDDKNPSQTSAEVMAKCVGNTALSSKFDNIVWTYNMRRLAVLVGEALRFSEPVLLVGDTGCGKTTICQIYAEAMKKMLHTVNCHMHSESSDFLGGLRPARREEENPSRFFEWVDGPLINAMRKGDFFLADEISLADDSVLERLNSVLETERSVLLSEKGVDEYSQDTVIRADECFRFLATMNPGGDYGKKELSPALRNRFTEIWCPSDLDREDLVAIVEHNIKSGMNFPYASSEQSGYGEKIAEFLKFFLTSDVGKRSTISIRDIQTWVEFINAAEGKLSSTAAYIHGAFLVFVDGLGSGMITVGNANALRRVKEELLNFLLCHQDMHIEIESVDLFLPEYNLHRMEGYPVRKLEVDGVDVFGIGPFEIESGPEAVEDDTYNLNAPTPKANAVRILRAMQLPKPILLEGSPGVGKTSLIMAMAKASGHKLVRINLSEQTDISDLFGADLPVEGGEKGKFAWRDGPFIQALRHGHWILLDELNLASQTVLEGLNACLDHRSEIYIPETGKTFYLEKCTSRIFGCQNPHKQGGSRKGLPRSFLNRFTQVYLQPLSSEDMVYIASSMFPVIPPSDISFMVAFNRVISQEINEGHSWNPAGYPFDFNLRDILRWCDALLNNQDDDEFNPGEYVQLIYADRMRTLEDKEKIFEIFKEVFKGYEAMDGRYRPMDLLVFDTGVQVGYSFLPRLGNIPANGKPVCVLHSQLPVIESLMKCLEMRWMPILVGPAASGKSTLAHILSSLTGHPLQVMTVNSEMDTTELLGGFEQADIMRHLSSAYQELEPIIEHSVCQCVRHGDERSLQLLYNLMHLIDRLKHISISHTSASTAQESKFCRQKVKYMLELILIMHKMPLGVTATNALLASEQALIRLNKQLNSTKGTSGCGKFEWVDSVLVQAVKKGHWLLIDNANFCSPSVLDRLNGLLEPNGVLTITEQGVVGDELITIEPHAEFRIILTMDPKNGEISRAMRNRGLEIYVESMSKKSDFINLDFANIIQNQGVVHAQIVNHLFRIHQNLMKLSVASEEPSMYELINAASLCTQMLQKHENFESAIMKSLQTVYVQNVLNTTTRKEIMAIIEAQLADGPKIMLDLKMFQWSVPRMFPSVSDYQQNSVLASLKKQTLLLMYLLKFYEDSCSESDYISDPSISSQILIRSPLVGAFESLTAEDWIVMVIDAVRMMFESCSIRDWKLISLWLENYLPNCVSAEKSNSMVLHMIQLVLTYKNNHFDVLWDDPVVTHLVRVLTQTYVASRYGDVDKEEIPLDPRWNQLIYKKMLLFMKKTDDDCDIDVEEDKLISATNRFRMKLLVGSKQYLNEDLVCMKVGECKSFYRLSADVMSEQMSVEDLPFPWIAKIEPLHTQFHNAICTELENHTDSFADEDYWRMFESLTWYYHFVKICCEPTSRDLNEHYSNIAVYWQWFLKRIDGIFLDKRSLPSELKQLILQITNELVPKSAYENLRRKLVKLIGAPPAFYDDQVAGLANDISTVFQVTNIIPRAMAKETKLDALKVIVTNGPKWSKVLTDAARKCLTSDYESKNEYFDSNSRSAVNLIKLQLRDAGLLNLDDENDDDDDDDIMEVCPTPAETSKISTTELTFRTQLLPLWDYLFMLSQVELIADTSEQMVKHILEDSQMEDSFQVESNISLNFITTAGNEVLGLEPFELALLLELQDLNPTDALAACSVSFSQHLRNGASSNGLKCLQWDPRNEKKTVANTLWDTKFLWCKQMPLLSYICCSLLEGSSRNVRLLSVPLGDYYYKIAQVQTITRVLWTNFEKLANLKDSFRMSAANIVISCFENLVRTFANIYKVSVPADLFGHEDKDMEVFDVIASSCGLLIISGVNLLAAARVSLKDLKSEMSKPAKNMTELQWYLGKSFALVGLLSSILMLPRDVMDPAIKRRAKMHQMFLHLREVKMEYALRNWHNLAMTGQHLEIVGAEIHPYIAGLANYCSELENRTSTMERRNGCRPTGTQFYAIKSKIDHYISLVGSPASVLEMMDKMEVLKSSPDESNPKLVLQEVSKWSNNQETFAESLPKEYPHYRDIILPFIDGVEKTLMGIQMMSHGITTQEVCRNFPNQQFPSIESFLSKLCSFPSNESERPLDTALLLLNPKTIATFQYLLALRPAATTSPSANDRLIFKLLKSAILEAINEATVYNDRGNSDVPKLLVLGLDHFKDVWVRQEEEAKLKKEKEEALYEHKMKSHDTEPSDEEQLEAMKREQFPSFEEQFSGCIPQDILNSEEKKTPPPKIVTPPSVVLSQADMFEVWRLHATAVSLLATTDQETADQESLQHVIKSTQMPDYVTPHRLRCEVVSKLISEIGDKLDASLDKKLLGMHLLAGQELLDLCSADMPAEKKKTFDIYHDSDPGKVLSMYPLLNDLRQRLLFLLDEFPENPNLIIVLQVVNRVLSFDITEPLMKFVVGLELILTAAQTWEQNSHMKVTLRHELQPITKKVLECRKLELTCWRECLDSVMREQFRNCSKWWFHLYILLSSLISDTHATSVTNWEKEGRENTIKALQKFLEDSPLGEFQARLCLLHTFLQYVQILKPTVLQKKIHAALYNIFTFYNQFLPMAKEKITLVRTPIEKDLRNFVKVAKWNDINYFRAKASVEKAHRTIVNHMKAFKKALAVPANVVFTSPSKTDVSNGETTPWVLEIHWKDFLLRKTEPVSEAKGVDVGDDEILTKLSHFNKKMKKLSKSIMDNFPIINHVNTLNEFAGDIVDTLENINTPQGAKGAQKETRKKTNLLMQRKKKALANLFIHLRIIGLSYRKGIIYCDQKTDTELMSVAVLNASQLKICKGNGSADDLFAICARDSNHYFYKSIGEFSTLMKSLESPSKDLVIEIIHKSRGFSGHMMQLVIQQREALVDDAKNIESFGSYVDSLVSLSKSEVEETSKNMTVFPPQIFVLQWKVVLCHLLVRILSSLDQFNSFLDCCPTSPDTQSEDAPQLFPEVPPMSTNRALLATARKGDHLWMDIRHQCEQCIDKTRQLITKVSSSLDSGDERFNTWQNLLFIGDCFKGLRMLSSNLAAIVEIAGRDGFSHFTNNVSNLITIIVDEWSNFHEEYGSVLEQCVLEQSSGEVSKQAEQSQLKILRLCNRIIKEVLLSVQDMIQFCKANQAEANQVEDVTQVPDRLFTEKISEHLLNAKKNLRFDRVMKLVKLVMRRVGKFQNSSNDLRVMNGSLSLLVSLNPLLSQYLQLLKVYLAVNFGMHRTSCKLLSILLGVFNIVATKGFCLPPELQKEALKGGATDFQDIEDGGLGEGEGEKDVSETITSEDQLEEAMKEGQEEKKSSDETPDIKNEKEGIEMSEDFEGKEFGPDEENQQESGDDEGDDDEEELDKKMGDVDGKDSEKLDEKIWGSDVEEDDEDDLKDDEETMSGVPQTSELAAKDNKQRKDYDSDKQKEDEKTEDMAPQLDEEQYGGEHPDPLIDAPPDLKPEELDLPENMQIDDEAAGSENEEEKAEDTETTKDVDGEEAEQEDFVILDEEDESKPGQDTKEGEEVAEENDKEKTEMAEADEENQTGDAEDKQNEALPTQSSTLEIQAMPTQDQKKSSSHDPVESQEGEEMDWESGAKDSEEQHQEGQAEANKTESQDAGHEGHKASAPSLRRESPRTQQQRKQTFKPPEDKRTIDDSDDHTATPRPIAEQSSKLRSGGERDDEADAFEHVDDKKDDDTRAVDIATEEQAAIRPVQTHKPDEIMADEEDDDDDVIQLDSSSDEEEICHRAPGSRLQTDVKQGSNTGEMDANDGEMQMLDGDIIRTHTAKRNPESTIHTQHDLWSTMSFPQVHDLRSKAEERLDLYSRAVGKQAAVGIPPDELWHNCEAIVSHLAQELCEQLRLVLEPTKMSKLKGDYRTGKRLNMRKIIPYIASQFRKDKIWLRRTKPSKRQYQIMLAVDDSSSMSDNHSKQLAFESLAVLGRSLSLLEAGELAVASFGERVELMLGFNEPFTACTGPKLMQQFTFAQRKTNISQLVRYATDAMVQSRSSHSKLMSRETAQLLVIISDGRGIFNEGEEVVKKAVRKARDNNIFMVFLVMDSPMNKDSILDIRCPVFDSCGLVEMKSYMEVFPFPFYILLRDISSLPQVLGEALRQWFELVTSVER